MLQTAACHTAFSDHEQRFGPVHRFTCLHCLKYLSVPLSCCSALMLIWTGQVLTARLYGILIAVQPFSACTAERDTHFSLMQGLCKTAEEAMTMYARKRTMDGNGVTNPSQRRYCSGTI